MCVERLACIQFERSDQKFKSAHATNVFTNRLQHKSAVVNTEQLYWPTPARELASRLETERAPRTYTLIHLLYKSHCIIVGRPPKVKLSPNEELIRRMTRTTFHLTCEFSGNPPPIVEWYKDSVLITASQNVEINRFDKFLF